jgi:superfamily I DNA/RNA helicase
MGRLKDEEKIRPTDEQRDAVRIFGERRPLKIAAFAGTGKTSTLIFMAESRRSRGLYLAFNNAIAKEAKGKLPRDVQCRTTHSMAFQALIRPYRSEAKLITILRAPLLASLAAYPLRSFGRKLNLTAVQQAHLVLGTITRFCQSADPNIGVAHVPRYGRLLGASSSTLAEVRAWSVAEATAIWQRMANPDDDLPLGHDGYLKVWALGRPDLNVEYILLDEAQDTNQVVLGVLRAQNSQIVYVGDRHQQIYEWRGAVNAMEQVTGCDETSLTQSFRFGEAIAEAASRVLGTLGETRRLTGNPDVRSTVVSASEPTRAVLARTNANVIVEVLDAIRARRKPFIVGRATELIGLLKDVDRLKKRQPALSSEFLGLENWREVVEFSESEEGESLRTFVQLVQQYGEEKLRAAVENVHDDEHSADVVLSTAHKAKGCQWDSVRLATDFASSRSKEDLGGNEAETRLFYVAMTRARKTLVVDPALLKHFTTKTREPRAETSLAATSPAAAADPAGVKKSTFWKRFLGG